MTALWEKEKSIILVEGGYIGVTAPASELHDKINELGWKVTKIAWQKNTFVAKGETEDKQKLEATGPTEADALAQLLVKCYNVNKIRTLATKTASMDAQWLKLSEHMNDIAQEYAKAPFYDAKAAIGFQELAADSKARAEMIMQQISVEIVDNPAPYTDANKLFEDVRKRQHLFVSKYQSAHPIWTQQDMINFRIVHLVFGYCNAEAQFGWKGEVEACSSHSQYLTTGAKRALLTDRIGQMAFSFYSGGYQPKIAFLKDTEQQIGIDEHKPDFGVHPSQMVMPTEIPNFNRASSNKVKDPNADWKPEDLGIVPFTNNAYTFGGDPLDSLGAMENAAKIDTDWHQLDFEQAKKAVGNALKAVILSPRKDLKSNAIHYQDIRHIDSDDPEDYHNALETAKENHNQSKGFPPGSHRTYYKEQQKFRSYIVQMNPEMSPKEAMKEADREWNHLWNDIEEKYLNDPKMADKGPRDIEQKVAKDISKAIKNMLNPAIKTDTDVPDKPKLSAETNYDSSQYPAFLSNHNKAIAAMQFHLDEITKAAIEDAKGGGAGHHFRSTLLSLKIPNVDAKTASFAWLLLSPLKSQLATMDSHMNNLIGESGKSPSHRDYYKNERIFNARSTAAGYGHVPLGLRQWMFRDAAKDGMGAHKDLSTFKVKDPLQHHLVDWTDKKPNLPKRAKEEKKNPLEEADSYVQEDKEMPGGGEITIFKGLKEGIEKSAAPIITTPTTYDSRDPNWQWWQDTGPIGQLVNDDWQKNIAPFYKSDEIPQQPGGLQKQASTEDDTLCYLAVPSASTALTIYEWVASQDWPEGTEIEDPDNYHITLFMAEDGWNDEANHIWLKGYQAKDIKCKIDGIDSFGPNKDTIVLRIDSPDLNQIANRIKQDAVDKDITSSQFYKPDAEYKAHMTIATKSKKLTDEYPHLEFRIETTALSIPLNQPRFSSVKKVSSLDVPWHVDEMGNMVQGEPGQSLMFHLRNTYGLTPEQVWQRNWNELGKQFYDH